MVRFLSVLLLLGNLCAAFTLSLSADLCAAPLSSSPAYQNPGIDTRKKVLLLYSYGHGGKGVTLFDEGLLSVLNDAGVSPNDLYFEYIDAERNIDDKEYLPRLRDFLLRKYRDRQVELIITVQQPAVRFLLNEGKKLSPGVPAITVQSPIPTDAEAGDRRLVCQVAQFDVKGTVERALELFPQTKRILVVSGHSDADRAMERTVAKITAPWRGKIDFDFAPGLSLEELLKKVSRLPPHTIILFTQYNRDPGGHVFLAYEVEGMITKVANAPVFGLYDFNLINNGIGGSVISVKGLGETTAMLALDILSGAVQLTRPTTAAQNKAIPMFNWKQIERWGGDAGSLPKNAVLINRVPGTWDQYKAYIVGGGSLLLVQLFLIIALVMTVRAGRGTQRELKDTEARYRLMFERSPDGVLVIDPGTGRLLEFNEAAHRHLGYSREEFAKLSIADFEIVESSEEVRKHINTIVTTGWDDFETLHRTKEGEIRNVHITAQMAEIQGRSVFHAVWRDVTDRKRAEEERAHLESQLLQSQKMEAIGTLAGGIAHDFNNILTVITGFATILERDLDKDCLEVTYVSEILSSSHRAANLTQSLLAFSRKQRIDLLPRKINEIVEQATKLLNRLLTEDIELEVALTPADPAIMADITQIDQILINLATNARDAMPKGGTMRIETGITNLDNEFMKSEGYGEPGDHVLLSVSDTGIGMDEATRRHIFEPFYTTKEVGAGTGLGLSTVYGVVNQHKGHIAVTSKPGKGTVFRIWFPLVHLREREAAVEKEEAKKGCETVLVAEDDTGVRKLITDVLTRHGYEVIAAFDGEEAIQQFLSHRDKISMIVCDVVMPKKNGKEVCDEIKKISPEMKVLFVSGYTRDVIVNKGVEDGTVDFINKPLRVTQFLTKVREVLDR